MHAEAPYDSTSRVGDSPPVVPPAPPVAGARAGWSRSTGPARFQLVARDGLIAGVAAGIGHYLGIPIAAVRAGLVILAFAGGAGVIVYLTLWVLAQQGDVHGPPPSGPIARRKATSLVPILFGLLLLLRGLGLWFGDGLVWPVALAGVGALVIGSRTDDESDMEPRSRPGTLAGLMGSSYVDGSRRRAAIRVGAGALLVAVGMTAFLAATDSLAAVREITPAVAVTITGLALIGGPVIYRLGRQLADERRDRIRSQARADMAAHLHDSVLQTLALIQRSGSAREMVTLARGQERELRAWLYAERGLEDELDKAIRDAVDELVARSEQRFQIAVDPIVVGDAPVDDAVIALIEACGEAIANAAKHAGVQDVSVYVEVEPDTVTAFVRDAGKGFEPELVPSDRRGISHSICDRLERHGGHARVETAPGQGTEWQLTVPRARERSNVSVEVSD